jgi:hypothetical protein
MACSAAKFRDHNTAGQEQEKKMAREGDHHIRESWSFNRVVPENDDA